MGIVFLITFAVSIAAVVQRNHVTIGFVVLNYLLLMDVVVVLVVGTMIWFTSLRQRNEFQVSWTALPPSSRITLQDEVRSFF